MKEILMSSVGFFEQYGEIGLFIMAFVESSFFPIPPDVLLIGLCLANPHLSFVYALICTFGSALGGIFGYGIGKYGGRPIVLKIFNKEKVELVQAYYDKYGVMAVGIAGFTPIPYKVFTITSGLFKLEFIKFFVVSVFSRGARFFIVATTLFVFGESIKDMVVKYLNVFSVVFVVLLICGFYVIHLGAKKAGKVNG